MKVKSNSWYKKLLISLLSISAIALLGNISPVQSQIVPDDTLDEESSRVTPDVEINGVKSDRLDGGAARGGNLFHSFSEFNVGEGQGAYFTNPAGIENILSRVTGGNPSEILGRLGVTGGDANLFLINPNGIIFSNNASLDLGGSFMATTANGIGLGEDGSFNATQPQTSNLLSVNPSALFFNAVAAQAIVNRSQATGLNGETNSLGDPVGLQVAQGKSLALVGGDMLLDGGNLTATGGRIELGSVAGVGEVSLEPSEDSWLLGYEEVKTFGDIKIQGGIVEASEGSSKIETGNLIVSNGGQVSTGTLTEGDGGDLSVNASESVQVIRTSEEVRQFPNVLFGIPGGFFGKVPSYLFTGANGGGDAGNLTIETGNLIVRDGALVSASTLGQGNGGDLSVNASESVQVIGTSIDGQYPSALFALTQGSGDAGNLTIETGNLIVSDGAQVSTTTFSGGDGGNLKINASESVQVIGTSTDGQLSSTLITEPGLFAQTQGSGGAGNLTIETGNLIISDGATISNNSTKIGTGTGTAGDLTLNVWETLMVDNGDIATNTTQSSGGAINITAGDIRLRGDSDIKTNVSSGAGNGGDINLTADSIVAFDDSDIISSASDGQGGDINLNTSAFFGDGYQNSSSNTNQNSLENNDRVDINATGAFNGIITIPDVSFIQNNLATLPQVFLNTNDLIASSCIARRDRQTGSFTITGNDSLPTPTQSDNFAYPTGTVQNIPGSNVDSDHRPWKKGDPIIEPTGVYRLPNGELVMSRECSQ
jgi:filamentous hemagglutinin family protein